MGNRVLSHEEARSFYDRFGTKPEAKRRPLFVVFLQQADAKHAGQVSPTFWYRAYSNVERARYIE